MPAAQEHARLERKLQALTREIQRLLEADQAGVIEFPALQTRRQRVEDQSRVWRQRRNELEDSPLSPTPTPSAARGRGVVYEYAGSGEDHKL